MRLPERILFYIESVVGVAGLGLAVYLVALALIKGGHGSMYVLIAAFMCGVTGLLLVLGALGIRARHPLRWIPQVLLLGWLVLLFFL